MISSEGLMKVDDCISMANKAKANSCPNVRVGLQSPASHMSHDLHDINLRSMSEVVIISFHATCRHAYY